MTTHLETRQGQATAYLMNEATVPRFEDAAATRCPTIQGLSAFPDLRAVRCALCAVCCATSPW